MQEIPPMDPTSSKTPELLKAVLGKLDHLNRLEDTIREWGGSNTLQHIALNRIKHRRHGRDVAGGNQPPLRRADPWIRAKFDGHDDLLPFINKCEHYFRDQHTLEEEKV